MEDAFFEKLSTYKIRVVTPDNNTYEFTIDLPIDLNPSDDHQELDAEDLRRLSLFKTSVETLIMQDLKWTWEQIEEKLESLKEECPSCQGELIHQRHNKNNVLCLSCKKVFVKTMVEEKKEIVEEEEDVKTYPCPKCSNNTVRIKNIDTAECGTCEWCFDLVAHEHHDMRKALIHNG